MPIVGIDLGTTNSVVATMEHGQAQVLSNAEGKQTTPSVVYFRGSGLDDTIVGEPALFSLAADPERVVRFIKREMGTDFKINIDGQTYTPEQISSLILKKLKNDAQTEHFGEEEVTDAVVTVPAYFGPQEREATKKAAEQAGLNVLALLPEPIAAAIDFAQNQAEKLADKTVLVYDLGGGTFDVTVMRVDRQGGEDGPLAFRILGKDGSVQLGGADWDQKLAEYVCEQFAAANDGSNPQDDLISYLRLLMECQRAKEALSIKNPEDTIQIPCTHGGVTYAVEISRQKFEELTQPLLEYTIDKAGQLVKRLFGEDDPWRNVDLLVLAGGSTKMRCVHEVLEGLSGMKPTTWRGADLKVARGAAYLAFSEGGWQIDAEESERRTYLGAEVLAHECTGERTYHPAEAVTDASEKLAATRLDMQSDLAHFSVTYPPTMVPGGRYCIDVWGHLREQYEEVLGRARDTQGELGVQARTRAGIEVARGTSLTVRLQIPGFVIEDDRDTIVWNGNLTNVAFLVFAPDDSTPGAYQGAVVVSGSELPIAMIPFAFTVSAREATGRVTTPMASTYRSAFASYASADRNEVLGRIQGLQKILPELDVFLDVKSLRSGENWYRRLCEEIVCRDVFYLFWSRAASRSPWVEREWRTALEQRGIEYIDPIPLESPQIAPPPDELAGELHFNDWVLAFKNDGSPAETSSRGQSIPADGQTPIPGLSDAERVETARSRDLRDEIRALRTEVADLRKMVARRPCDDADLDQWLEQLRSAMSNEELRVLSEGYRRKSKDRSLSKRVRRDARKRAACIRRALEIARN